MVREVGWRHGQGAQHPRLGGTRAPQGSHISVQLSSSSAHQPKSAAQLTPWETAAERIQSLCANIRARFMKTAPIQRHFAIFHPQPLLLTRPLPAHPQPHPTTLTCGPGQANPDPGHSFWKHPPPGASLHAVPACRRRSLLRPQRSPSSLRAGMLSACIPLLSPLPLLQPCADSPARAHSACMAPHGAGRGSKLRVHPLQNPAASAPRGPGSELGWCGRAGAADTNGSALGWDVSPRSSTHGATRLARRH